MIDESIKLTENEKKVLKELTDKGRITDTKLADSMAITQQAVYQIRNRLESLGIIEGYEPILNLKKIGIKIIWVIGIEILPEMWENLKEHEITKRLQEIPHTLKIIRLPSSDISYIIILGLKSIIERETLSAQIETKLAKKINIVWSYTTSCDNYIEKNKTNCIDYATSKKEFNYTKLIEKLNKK
ncbi:MAG: Lrp/AsnC family transcriptional regulator [Candidatus Woesearchaeota archaeon]